MSRGSATMSAPGEACSDKVHCQKGGVLSGKGRGWRVSRGWLRGGLVRAPGRAEVAEVFHGGDLPLCQFLSFPLQRFSFRVPLLFSLRSPGHPPSPPPPPPRPRPLPRLISLLRGLCSAGSHWDLVKGTSEVFLSHPPEGGSTLNSFRASGLC